MRDNHPGVRPGWLSREYQLVGVSRWFLPEAGCWAQVWQKVSRWSGFKVVFITRRGGVSGRSRLNVAFVCDSRGPRGCSAQVRRWSAGWLGVGVQWLR